MPRGVAATASLKWPSDKYQSTKRISQNSVARTFCAGALATRTNAWPRYETRVTARSKRDAYHKKRDSNNGTTLTQRTQGPSNRATMADRGRGGSFRGGFRGGRGGGGGSGAGPGHDGQGGSSESHQQQRGGRGGAHRGGGGGQRGGARGRGGGGAGGGGGGGYSRGGGGGRGGAGAHGQGEREKKPKENILDLSKYMDKGIIVKFSGGREGQLTLSCRWPPAVLRANSIYIAM